jgi:hypothetical protein
MHSPKVILFDGSNGVDSSYVRLDTEDFEP